MQRDADLTGATEQYQRQHPFIKGGSEHDWFGAREEVPAVIALPRCSPEFVQLNITPLWVTRGNSD